MPTDVEFFANPASTAGGDGTTPGTTGSTRAFVSMQAAIDGVKAAHGAMTTNDERVIITGVAGNGTDTTAVNAASADWVGDATRYLWLRGDTYNTIKGGAGYRIALDAGFNLPVLQSLASFVEVTDLQIHSTRIANYARGVALAASAKLKRCIISGEGIGANSLSSVFSGFTPIVESCLIDGWGGGGLVINNFVNGTVTNTTVANCLRNFDKIGTSGSNAVATNCAAYNGGTDWTGTDWTGSHNASSDSTEPGTSPITTDIDSADFADAVGGDFRIADTSSTLYNTGTATGRPALDLQGNAFTTNDIGCYAFLAAASGRIMGGIAGKGGLAGMGGIAGIGGGMAG